MLSEQVLLLWVRTDPNTEVLTTAVFLGGYIGFIMFLGRYVLLSDPLMTSEQASSDHHGSKAASNASRASIAATGKRRVRTGPNAEVLTTAVFLSGYFESNMSLDTYTAPPDPLMTSEQAASDQHESKAASNAFGA